MKLNWIFSLKKTWRNIRKEVEIIFSETHYPKRLNTIQSEVMNACKLVYFNLPNIEYVSIVETLRYLLSQEAYPVMDYKLITDEQILKYLLSTYITCDNKPMSVQDELDKLNFCTSKARDVEHEDLIHLNEESMAVRTHLIYYINKIHKLKLKERSLKTKKLITLIDFEDPKYVIRFTEHFKTKV